MYFTGNSQYLYNNNNNNNNTSPKGSIDDFVQ